VHRRLDLLVRTWKQSARIRKTELACDARMVARIEEITCSEWITRTLVLCTQYACVTSIVISCVRRGKLCGVTQVGVDHVTSRNFA
jgi:hypothetical protein